MADTKYFLTEADVLFLRQLKQEHEQRAPVSPPYRTEDRYDDHKAPDTHIVAVVDPGIPALTSGTVTGTAGGQVPEAGDTPGQGTAYRYQLINGELSLMTLWPITVYNLNAAAILQGWYLATRDKWGNWFILSPWWGRDTIQTFNQPFVTTATAYVAQGGFLNVVDGYGVTWSAYAAFGAVQHGASLLCVYDNLNGQYVIAQIACPTGTATSHV